MLPAKEARDEFEGRRWVALILIALALVFTGAGLLKWIVGEEVDPPSPQAAAPAAPVQVHRWEIVIRVEPQAVDENECEPEYIEVPHYIQVEVPVPVYVERPKPKRPPVKIQAPTLPPTLEEWVCSSPRRYLKGLGLVSLGNDRWAVQGNCSNAQTNLEVNQDPSADTEESSCLTDCVQYLRSNQAQIPKQAKKDHAQAYGDSVSSPIESPSTAGLTSNSQRSG
ncbi:MAG: hypothetical protein KC431_25385 [Myxococcales bacterium]|nr:hypothetical protein [Myxococcales bacterium]